MQVRLTNTSSAAVPIVVPSEDGYAEAINPQQPYDLDDPDIDVVIVGDKPDLREQLTEGLSVLKDTVIALVTTWRDRVQPNPQLMTPPVVQITIENKGEQAVRAILGDGTTDYTVAPGTSYEAEAKGYIELRELGNVNQNVHAADQPAAA